MNDYTEAWQPAIEAYAVKNNRLFQEKQMEAITLLAAGYGIDIISAVLDLVEGEVLDFDIDYVEIHHIEFLNKVEMIMETQDVKELEAAIENMKKERKSV
jgi:hypothetical protein